MAAWTCPLCGRIIRKKTYLKAIEGEMCPYCWKVPILDFIDGDELKATEYVILPIKILRKDYETMETVCDKVKDFKPPAEYMASVVHNMFKGGVKEWIAV